MTTNVDSHAGVGRVIVTDTDNDEAEITIYVHGTIVIQVGDTMVALNDDDLAVVLQEVARVRGVQVS